MNTCICCCQETKQSNYLAITLCPKCENQLLPSFIDILINLRETICYSSRLHLTKTKDGRIFYEGTWTKDNWEQYPTVIEIRNSVSIAPQTKEEDHTGQIYNPFTDSWSWF